MLFAIYCYDKPDSLGIRQATRPVHLEYLSGAGDRVKIAGPILSSGDDGSPIGSLIIVDAASETAAQLFAENDPYASAGLFDRVEIHPWRRGVGSWGEGE